MRVAVFTDNDFDKVNGVTTALSALLDYAPPDVSLRIYTASDRSIETPRYFALQSLGMPIPFYREMRMFLPPWWRYLRQVVADDIDVVHVTTPGPMGLVALWVAAKTGLPLVGSFHTDLARYTAVLSGWPWLGRLMDRYLRWMYGRCSCTLVPSKATRDLMTSSGARPQRLAIWPRGVDTTLFTPARRSDALRARWRIPPDGRVLLYVGRVSREKGLEMLPAVLQRLQAQGIAHRLVVAGDGPLRPWLAKRLPEAVFTGTLTREEVADTFASADLFFFPSATDTAGNVVLEAQASGLPVIVSVEGGPREHMSEGVTGLVVRSREPSAWAASAADLLADDGRRRVMGDAARAFALGRRWESALAPVYAAYRATTHPEAREC